MQRRQDSRKCTAMLFDLSILFSTVLGLFRIREARSSPLWVRLCRQGFVYFLATFLVNLLTLVSAHP